MSRHIAATALILMLLTGLVLGQLYTLGRAAPTVAPTSDNSAGQTAVAFYDAVNRYLETGDATEIDDLLAPDFVNRPTPAAPDESADGLMRSLDSLRATFPGLRFKVTNTIAQDDSVVVDLSLTGDAAGTFAGLAVDLENPSTGYERLSLRGDQVVERLGSPGLPPLYEPAAEAWVSAVPNANAEARVERLTFDEGASVEYHDRDGFILLVESGALSFLAETNESGAVQQFSAAGSGTPVAVPVTEGETARIETRESIAVPAITPVRIWNGGSGPATALVIMLRHLYTSDYIGQSSAWVPKMTGVDRELLTFGWGQHEALESSVLSVGWVTIAPGLELPRHAVSEAELVYVTAGSIEATVLEGEAGWLRPNMGLSALEGRQLLETGQGFSAQADAEVEYRATGSTPATLLFVGVRVG